MTATRQRAPAAALLAATLVLAATTVLLQVAYPLVHGPARNTLTVVTVVTFFLASAMHALAARGAPWTAAFVAVTAGTGLVAEAVGVRTGLPFGRYIYADSLGLKVLDVPLVVPLAWSMFAYPSLLVGQRLCRSATGAAVTGALALASWDLFLDPQMVAAGHWRWSNVTHHLPGVDHVPVSNFLGWGLVALLMTAALQRLPRHDVDDRVPHGLFLWTFVSSVLANAVFFDRPGVALVGGVVMGTVALPFLRSLRG